MRYCWQEKAVIWKLDSFGRNPFEDRYLEIQPKKVIITLAEDL
jgi:hypothetical protein